MTSFNWDDISINTENPEAFFKKRHIKHERVYYDLISGRNIPKTENNIKENDKENIIKSNAAAKRKVDIDKQKQKCENPLKISNKTNSSNQQGVKLKAEVPKCKTMLPPTRPKAYDYAEIYKKRKEVRAIEAVQKVVPPPSFKSKPLPTFYSSTKTASNVKPNRVTVPVTPMVLKRSAINKKNQNEK